MEGSAWAIPNFQCEVTDFSWGEKLKLIPLPIAVVDERRCIQ
jgi:hypothetical protein